MFKTNTSGEIDFDGFISEIKIDNRDYFYLNENVEKEGFFKITLSKIKTKDIQEVVIKKKDSIINYYKPRRENLNFSCNSETTNNLSILVNFAIAKKIKIKNYSFFITTIEKYNSNFNFVIYKKNGEKLEKIFSIEISNYFKNNNTIDLSARNLFLDKGEYYFGMEWIISDKMKINTLRQPYKKYPEIRYIGQDLGGSLRNQKENQTFLYSNSELNSTINKSFQQLKISL